PTRRSKRARLSVDILLEDRILPSHPSSIVHDKHPAAMKSSHASAAANKEEIAVSNGTFVGGNADEGHLDKGVQLHKTQVPKHNTPHHAKPPPRKVHGVRHGHRQQGHRSGTPSKVGDNAIRTPDGTGDPASSLNSTAVPVTGFAGNSGLITKVAPTVRV